MPRAIFNGEVIAESYKFEIVEGNVYFPPDSIKRQFFSETTHHTHCGWKGEASYYTVKVGEREAVNAAWFYPETLPEADNIRGYVAFYRVVTVER